MFDLGFMEYELRSVMINIDAEHSHGAELPGQSCGSERIPILLVRNIGLLEWDCV
jgi:hypothetical protein